MRRGFWPTVLLGGAGSVIAAVAGNHAWAERADSFAAMGGATGAERPAVTALALVALASWGVLLVTRGIVRRGVAVLAALAAGAGVIASVVGLISARSDVSDVGWFAYSEHPADPTLTAWGFVAVVATLLATLAGVLAVLRVPAWPEMGRKYDAPTTAAASTPETSLDVWKAIDEGRDPTEPDDH